MQATRKVIIADESREFAVPCASLLKSFGVEAILVPKDGEALYEAIVAQKPQAVLCDVFMPHSDAIGVMKRVREEDDLPQLRDGDFEKFLHRAAAVEVGRLINRGVDILKPREVENHVIAGPSPGD